MALGARSPTAICCGPTLQHSRRGAAKSRGRIRSGASCMSWVLILTNTLADCPPAVIGGYASMPEAEAAGMLGTAFNPNPDIFDEAMPFYTRFLVIPGPKK